jgi:hypothetical protein
VPLPISVDPTDDSLQVPFLDDLLTQDRFSESPLSDRSQRIGSSGLEDKRAVQVQKHRNQTIRASLPSSPFVQDQPKKSCTLDRISPSEHASPKVFSDDGRALLELSDRLIVDRMSGLLPGIRRDRIGLDRGRN